MHVAHNHQDEVQEPGQCPACDALVADISTEMFGEAGPHCYILTDPVSGIVACVGPYPNRLTALLAGLAEQAAVDEGWDGPPTQMTTAIYSPPATPEGAS